MSSEALERALERLKKERAFPKMFLRDDEAAALLAEVVRLEQALVTSNRDYEELGASRERIADKADAAEAALAVARRREQRLRGALQQIANHNVRAPVTGTSADDPCDWHCTAQQRDLARAALVDEPAAATTRECPNCNGFGKVQDSVRGEPVTCGRCDGYGVIPAATLAGPDERPGGAAVTRSLDADTQSRLLSPASGSASAAADEPGETPA